MSTRLIPVLLVAGMGAWAGCTEKDPLFCSDDTGCAPTKKCDPNLFICIEREGPPPDMSVSPDIARECTAAAQCTDPGKSICNADGKCVACDANAQSDAAADQACGSAYPDKPICFMSRCVACLSNLDCAAGLKSCNTADHTCVACAGDADCATGICEPPTGDAGGNQCASPDKLVFVDAAVCPAKGSGKLTDPFCKIQDGIDSATAAGIKTILVRAGTYKEDLSVKVTGAAIDLTLLGQGKPTLQATGMANPALNVQGDPNGANSLTLTVDGFTVTGAQAANAVQCAATKAGTKLTLTRSAINGNRRIGLQSTGCNLTADAVVVGPGNLGGGILLTNSDFLITNAVVLNNGTAAGMAPGSNLGGIEIESVPNHGEIDNATVVGNSADTVVAGSGITCGTNATPPTIQNTVLRTNKGGLAEVNAAQCNIGFSSWASVAAQAPNLNTTMCNDADLFENPSMPPSGLKPKKGGTAPCTLVDVGTDLSFAQKALKHDLDGKPRPVPAGKMDIGAYEAQ